MGFFNKDPNALLVQTVSNLPSGKELDIAMGEGRNAVWLATKGWPVTGFDISDEALQQAEERARKAGVTIKAIKAASVTFDYGHERWDLIVMSCAFTPVPDAGYIARLRDSLKPGGLLVFPFFVLTTQVIVRVLTLVQVIASAELLGYGKSLPSSIQLYSL